MEDLFLELPVCHIHVFCASWWHSRIDKAISKYLVVSMWERWLPICPFQPPSKLEISSGRSQSWPGNIPIFCCYDAVEITSLILEGMCARWHLVDPIVTVGNSLRISVRVVWDSRSAVGKALSCQSEQLSWGWPPAHSDIEAPSNETDQALFRDLVHSEAFPHGVFGWSVRTCFEVLFGGCSRPSCRRMSSRLYQEWELKYHRS